MSKLTNRKLQEVKNNYYAVYTFGGDERRCGTISGCNIVRMAEEAQHTLCLVVADELEKAEVPKELFADLGLSGRSHKDTHPVWFWVMELEAANKRRATWQEVQNIFDISKAWLKSRAAV